jgi:hypothetical protein
MFPIVRLQPLTEQYSLLLREMENAVRSAFFAVMFRTLLLRPKVVTRLATGVAAKSLSMMSLETAVLLPTWMLRVAQFTFFAMELGPQYTGLCTHGFPGDELAARAWHLEKSRFLLLYLL